MLELRHFSKSFAAIHAVDDVSLRVKQGRITILTGADGAGKSTIFKMIIGLVKADRGELALHGAPVGANYSRLTDICGYMPERFSLYADLTVDENLNFFSDIHLVPRPRREELKQRLLAKTGMLPFKNRRAGALSGGMKQKLALSSILLASPQLIILDEPTTGVDPLSRIEFFNIIEELKGEGKTILLSTPYLDEAEKGDDIIFIKGGRIIMQNTIQDLRATFPAAMFQILPKGNIMDVLESLQARPALRRSVYARGRFLRYLQTGARFEFDAALCQEVHETAPTLEDIYIYYERAADDATAAGEKG